MKLDSADRTLREILKTYFFYIPRFQRPYSWEPEQVEELWEDAVQESAGDYFIGSMVVHKRGEDTVAVIDGQQRLTTLIMLLCVIRDFANEYGHTSLANGTHTFIERTDENDQARFVLNTETSYPYLHDQVMGRDDPQLEHDIGREEEAIEAAYSRLDDFVEATVSAISDNPTIAERGCGGESARSGVRARQAGGHWFEPSTAHLNPRSHPVSAWLRGSRVSDVPPTLVWCPPRCPRQLTREYGPAA
jgi:Protein of unknown function DUF262